MTEEELGNGTLEHWSPQNVFDALKEKRIVLIDVRTPQEYGLERIEGALNAPMAFVKGEDLPAQQGRPIVLHCGSGLRSERVSKQYLAALGGRIAHMDGGIEAWKKAGLPYCGTDMATGAPKRIEPAKS